VKKTRDIAKEVLWKAVDPSCPKLSLSIQRAKQEKSGKLSLNKKRSLASLNPDYRFKLLGVVADM